MGNNAQQQGHRVKYPVQRYYPWEAGAVLVPYRSCRQDVHCLPSYQAGSLDGGQF